MVERSVQKPRATRYRRGNRPRRTPVTFRRHALGWLFGVYLVLSSVERIIVEVFRAKDDRILGPVTVAQLLSVGLVVLGVWLMRRYAAVESEGVRGQR